MIFDSEEYPYYAYAQTNEASYYSNIDIVNQDTILKSYQLIHLAGGHLVVPTPEWSFINTDRPSRKIAYQYYIEGSDRYRLLEFMYRGDNELEKAAYHDFMQVMVVYHSLAEKAQFEEYVAFTMPSVYHMILENSRFDELKTGSFARNIDYKHKLRTGVILNEILQQWRGNFDLLTDKLYFTLSGTKASGSEQEDEHFIVYAGSQISPEIKDSCSMTNLKLRKEYSHIINENNELLEDLLFPSPSAASSFITASVTNGRLGWRRSDGVTLKSIQEYNKKAKEIQLDLNLY